MHAKVKLPLLKDPPLYLKTLLQNKDSKGRHFVKHIRMFNMMFSFTSMGGKVDFSINRGGAPWVFRLYGQNYHRIGTLCPQPGSPPKFLQLYIHDTDNEVSNRISAVSSGNDSDSFDAKIVNNLRRMLDEHNPLTQSFRNARDMFDSTYCPNLMIRLIGRRDYDGRTYNLPTASEVAALIVGDIKGNSDKRDIVVQTRVAILNGPKSKELWKSTACNQKTGLT
ncbi:hypothetical protein DCAR_0101578 [Daucus carota subsp. sativus]|uniref:Helitron helicase-like domain-containing protein n=1 Tax=Daucus carota subsp. sativus TaxID=79200 RepID=A0AAF0W3I6_DAUCS|nr:hypothetical protein DCAR_0101578 [Daucus carota subsp. sativus]